MSAEWVPGEVPNMAIWLKWLELDVEPFLLEEPRLHAPPWVVACAAAWAAGKHANVPGSKDVCRRLLVFLHSAEPDRQALDTVARLDMAAAARRAAAIGVELEAKLVTGEKLTRVRDRQRAREERIIGRKPRGTDEEYAGEEGWADEQDAEVPHTTEKKQGRS